MFHVMSRPYLLSPGVYPHEVASFLGPAASLTLYTSLLVHSAVLGTVH